MPIRIRIPQESQNLRKQNRRKRIMLSFGLSALFLFITGIILVSITTLILNQVEPNMVTYIPPDEPEPPQQKKVKDISSNTNPSTPPVQLITTATSSEVNIAVPEIVGTGMDFGSGLDMGGGLGDGAGPGGGMGGIKAENSTFAGQFWDLKKLKSGEDSPLKSGFASTTEMLKLLSKFYNDGWKTPLFDRYFKSPTKLYTTCFYMPFSQDEEAVNAFDPEGRIGLKPQRWVAVYTAKVQAPKSGKFRFVGFGDTILAVRFNQKNVLATGLHTIENGKPYGTREESYRRSHEFFEYASCMPWNSSESGDDYGGCGFLAGTPFEVKAGEWYDMEVLVTEIAGTGFGFCLLIDDMTDTVPKAKTPEGLPIFQLFRTAFVSPSAEESYANIKHPIMDEDDKVEMVDPPYDPASGLWAARPI